MHWCLHVYVYAYVHSNMSIEMTTESADQMMMKNISACDPFSNRTVPTQQDRLLRWVALMQLIKDPKRETKTLTHWKDFTCLAQNHEFAARRNRTNSLDAKKKHQKQNPKDLNLDLDVGAFTQSGGLLETPSPPAPCVHKYFKHIQLQWYIPCFSIL